MSHTTDHANQNNIPDVNNEGSHTSLTKSLSPTTQEPDVVTTWVETWEGAVSEDLNFKRRQSVSSYDSEAYASLQPGLYSINVDGTCPRCQHHHNSARVKFKLPCDSNEKLNIRCQGCREKWFIGGRNYSQLSFVSANLSASCD